MADKLDRWAAFCDWQDYPWHKELSMQMERVETYFGEVLADQSRQELAPLHHLEHALVLTAFAMRRLIEKRLVRDVFRDMTWSIRTFPTTSDFRPPFHASGGGEVFKNFDFYNPLDEDMRAWDVSNEIIHSAHLAVLRDSGEIGDGLLVASDWRMKKRVLHLPLPALKALVKATIEYRATTKVDMYDIERGEVISERP